MKRLLVLALLGAATVCRAAPLTLDEALAAALHQSKAGQLGRLKIQTADAELKAAQRLNFAQVHAYGASLYIKDPLEVKVARGSLTGVLTREAPALGLGPVNIAEFPTSDLSLARGSRTPTMGSLTVVQPLTQLWQIGSGVRAARAGVAEARRESEHIDAKLRVAVEELFAGLQVETRRIREKQAMLAWQERQLQDAEAAQSSGELLDDAVLGVRAAVVQARSELTRARQSYARLSLQLGDLIGQSGCEDLVVAEVLPGREDRPVSYWTAQAANNPERLIAAATVEKARAAVAAARQSYIPEVSLVGSVGRQDGVPLVARDSALAGVTLNWDVFDFGRRRAQVARAISQRRAAEVNRDRLEEEAARQIRLAHQDLVYADEQIGLAREAALYRRRAAELARQNAQNGLALETAVLAAEAELRKSEADLTGAVCQRHVALLHLYFLAGKL